MMADPDADSIFFIDADLGFSPVAFMHVLLHPADIAGAAYPLKTPDAQFTMKAYADKDGQGVTDNRGFVRVERLGTGFMRITKRAITLMQQAYPQTVYHDPDRSVYALFKTGVHEGIYYGEDYNFCRLYAELSQEMWCMLDATFEHVGHRSWVGNLHRQIQHDLDSRNALDEPKEPAPCQAVLPQLI